MAVEINKNGEKDFLKQVFEIAENVAEKISKLSSKESSLEEILKGQILTKTLEINEESLKEKLEKLGNFHTKLNLLFYCSEEFFERKDFETCEVLLKIVEEFIEKVNSEPWRTEYSEKLEKIRNDLEEAKSEVGA